MFLKKRFIINISLAIITASCIISLSETPFMRQVELLSFDALFQLRGPTGTPSHTAIIQIDDDDISEFGKWPWPRKKLAEIIPALNHFGAKAIFFDFLLSEPSREPGDDVAFEKTLEKAQNVYLPFAFKGPITNMIFANKPRPEFAKHAQGTGSINIVSDIDGKIRRIPTYYQTPDGLQEHIVLRLARDFLGLDITEISYNRLTLSDGTTQRKIPLVNRDKMLINWKNKWNKHDHYSFSDVMEAYHDVLNNKAPKIDTSALKDKLALVAVTAIGLYDIKAIPLSPAYPGVGIAATAIDNIINDNFLKVIPPWINYVFIYFFSLIPPILIMGGRPSREIFSIVSVVACFFITYALFLLGYRMFLALPLISLFTSYTVVAGYNFACLAVDKKKFFDMAITDELTGLYNIRYFRMILQTSCMQAQTNPEQHKFCIILCDVDDFKNFNDTYGHQAGDTVLAELSKNIKSSVRSLDIVARYGGEEIIILVRDVDLKIGMRVAENIRKNIEALSIRHEEKTLHATISLGVASFHGPQDTDDMVIKRADDGLYKAKQAGKNTVVTIE